MSSLLLINPNFERKINGQTPLNLAYLAAAIEAFVPVRIFDLNVRSFVELEKILSEFCPTHVGITSYTPNNISAKATLKQIHDQYPQVITISGGPHESYRGHITRKMYPWIDHVVTDRKGENALVEIMTGKNMRVDWRTIFPAYHLLDMNEPSYRFDQHLFEGKSMVQYMSSRGCNMRCLFCGTEDYIPLKVPVVVEHLKKIADLGYEAFFFNDVNFISSARRTAELSRQIVANGLNFLEWGCQTALVKEVTDEVLELMVVAGCSYITFSLENLSPDALRKIGKRIDPEYVTAKALFAKEIGMKIGVYVMFGVHNNEEEDWYWAKKTLDRIGEIKPDYVSYSILADYPSSNPNLPYETEEFGTEPVWQFFDEGRAYHPYTTVGYAEKLKTEIEKRHRFWPGIRKF
ncbi:MAG: radical SAM protein [Patescibacteria group bacterium]|jgi:radical SAM superfamily enzyme YgiQ (UPF0313 family)